GGREAATVQLDHRAQVRRDHRYGVQHHALRGVVGGEEGVDHLEALERAGLALTSPGGDRLAQRGGLPLQIEGLQALLDRLGAHVALEVDAVAGLELAVEQLVALEVTDLEVLEAVPDRLETLEVLVGTTPQLGHLALGGLAELLAGVGL